MTIFKRTTEEIEVGANNYSVCVTHRDWNPMPGFEDQMPEGTVWELITKFSYPDIDEGRSVCAVGSTKEEAIRNLFLQIGFHGGVATMKAHAKKAEPAGEHNLGNGDV